MWVCKCFLFELQTSKVLHIEIISTDIPNFGIDGITSFHNDLWAEENLHGVVQYRHQQEFCINVWAGTGNFLVGLYDLTYRLTGNKY
jgi:hypothetical protein